MAVIRRLRTLAGKAREGTARIRGGNAGRVIAPLATQPLASGQGYGHCGRHQPDDSRTRRTE